jgi:hypothetical protein
LASTSADNARADASREAYIQDFDGGQYDRRAGSGFITRRPARLIAWRQPVLVGVPEPIAAAKICNAVIPFPALALTVGSVTDATVLPACSGTDAK